MRSCTLFDKTLQDSVGHWSNGTARISGGNVEPARHVALVGSFDEVEDLGTELRVKGHIVTFILKTSDSPRALSALRPDTAVLVTDCNSDLDLIRSAVAEDINVVVVSRLAKERFRKEAESAGCRAFFPYPITADQLYRLFEAPSIGSAPRASVADNVQNLFGAPVLGNSPAMRQVATQVGKVAPTTASVLITGESGTGKEVAALDIHRLSRRRSRPFVAVNCGAIPAPLIESEFFGHVKGSFTGAVKDHAGYFERAHRGTLFLDEITEMPVELQVKLLRVLETQRFCPLGSAQERKVDIRVIAATNRDPETAVEEGLLRRDLLYRIRVFPLHLPPLRERKDDVELFSQHFLSECNAEEGAAKRFSDEAVDVLLEYSWPGNLRELKNAVHRAFIMADQIIQASDLPAEVTSPRPKSSGLTLDVQVGRSLADVEKDLILATLDHCKERRYRAARMLGVSEKTLYNRLRKYREDAEETRS